MANKMEIFTGIWNLITLVGFAVTYLVYIKALIPHILDITLGHENIPNILGRDIQKAEIFWAWIYTFLILIPISIPRKINTLRFMSFAGCIWTAYFIIWVIWLFFFDRKLVPNISQNLRDASYVNFTLGGMVHAIPYINFNYLNQPVIPIIYRELHHKSYSRMQNVVYYGSIICVVMYVLVSTFGYLGLVNHTDRLEVLDSTSDILEVKYDSTPFNIGVIFLCFNVIAVTPIAILPAKDTIEDLLFYENGMSNSDNYIVTIIVWLITLLCAVAFPGIDDAITVCGFTSYPLIGFILPWVFYLKMIDDIPRRKYILCWLTIIYISVTSITTFKYEYEYI